MSIENRDLEEKKPATITNNLKFSISELPELPVEDEVDLRKENLKEDGMTFSELLEKTGQAIKFRDGEVVEGTIIRVEKDFVTIDIGYKSEGQIPSSEFMDAEGKITVEPGDPVMVYIDKIEDDDGKLILSKERADVLRAWDEISEACQKNELVEGTVVSKVKGGLAVDIGVKAFLPGSQVDIRPIKNLDSFIGKTFKFKIIKFNKKRGNIVLSRKLLLMEERSRLKEQTLASMEEGMIVEGSIKNLTEYGAFIDLGGIDGLLHVTDMSWGRLKHPSELFKVGDVLKVKILKYDEDKERVSLGYKQLLPDPWNSVEEKYKIGDRVKGPVVSLTDYGAFVELEPGVEGLVHVSEMSWTQRVKHPSKLVSEGTIIDAIVLDIDVSNRRISLGMKQIEPNPWDILIEKYPVGSRIKGVVKNITDFGIFIGIPEGIDGLVHVSDMSWDTKPIDPNTVFKKGEEVECVVLSIDKEAEKFSLGIKQLTEDPWKEIFEQFKPGSSIKGVVTKITDFGVFVQVKEGVEGLIHISELAAEGSPKERIKEIKVGQEIESLVIASDIKDRKLSLSLKALFKAEERERIKQYKKSMASSKPRLGDIFEAALAEKRQREMEEVKTSEGQNLEKESSNKVDETPSASLQTESPEQVKATTNEETHNETLPLEKTEENNPPPLEKAEENNPPPLEEAAENKTDSTEQKDLTPNKDEDNV